MQNKLTISGIRQVLFLFILSFAVVTSPLGFVDSTVEIEDNTEERIYLQHSQVNAEKRIKPAKLVSKIAVLSLQTTYHVVDANPRITSSKLYLLYQNLRYCDCQVFSFS